MTELAKLTDAQLMDRLAKAKPERFAQAKPTTPAKREPAPVPQRGAQTARELVGVTPKLDQAQFDSAVLAGAKRFAGIETRDTVEDLLAVQMLALHNAALDCTRRAMIQGQPSEVRREELALAAKASRAFAQLVDTLDRRRRGGEQKVTVEHVHVHAGGQAVVGTVEVGGKPKNG